MNARKPKGFSYSKRFLVFFLLLFSLTFLGFADLEGFGSDSSFGFGGTVYRVTNLNTSGEGSFHAAVTAEGARIVVFEISGTIQQDGLIIIDDDDLCILGQTAPYPGIQMRGMVLSIEADDVLVQHLRFSGL